MIHAGDLDAFPCHGRHDAARTGPRSLYRRLLACRVDPRWGSIGYPIVKPDRRGVGESAFDLTERRRRRDLEPETNDDRRVARARRTEASRRPPTDQSERRTIHSAISSGRSRVIPARRCAPHRRPWPRAIPQPATAPPGRVGGPTLGGRASGGSGRSPATHPRGLEHEPEPRRRDDARMTSHSRADCRGNSCTETAGGYYAIVGMTPSGPERPRSRPGAAPPAASIWSDRTHPGIRDHARPRTPAPETDSKQATPTVEPGSTTRRRTRPQPREHQAARHQADAATPGPRPCRR